jgi:hypothetical protein
MTWIISKALMKDYENSRSSRGPGEESSADISSDGEQSVPSNGMPTHGTFWSPGKTTDASKPSRSGMTFKPLTDDLGEAVLMSYLEAFPVRTFPVQERERESKENEAPCGDTWQESSAKFDLASSSWKTHQCLWDEDLPSSSLTLPRWGMMRSGVLWERITLPPLISGTESGLWGTPRAGMGRSPACHYDRGKGNLEEQVGAAEYAKTWPTPCARDHKGVSGSGRQAKRGNPQDTLCNAVAGRMWPTPSAHKQTASGDLVNADGTPWDGESKPHSKKTGKPVQTALLDRVKMFPTPGANEDSYRLAGNSQQSNGLGAMARREALEQDPEVGGQLNPTWVEWLMNWPIGWTDTDTNCKHETEYWKAASSTANQSDQLREMWWNRESGAPPQRPESDKQRSVQSRGAVFQVPPSGALEDQSREMQSVRNVIPTEADKTSETLRQFRMQQDSREDISRVAVGIKCRVDRLRCIGNGQVPAVAKLAWEVLSK